MAQYTKLNLKEEVEDQAPKFGMSPGLEARFATGPLELEKSGVSYQKFSPGFRLPFGHKHKSHEELYVVVSGRVLAKIEDEVVELKPLDAVRVDNDTMRTFEAGPEGAELLAFGAPKAGDSPAEDVEMTQGWWK
jgi:mannose-6-phosphate isomerase-like protein (cupin superfamily)